MCNNKYSKQFQKVVKLVIEKSESKNWEDAIKEWRPLEVYYKGETERTVNCVCTQPRIKFLNRIINIKNGNEIYPLGSDCIKKFMSNEFEGMETMLNKAVSIRDKVNKGEEIEFNRKRFTVEFIEFLNEYGCFKNHDWNYKFIKSIISSKYKLTANQDKYVRITVEDIIIPFCVRGIFSK